MPSHAHWALSEMIILEIGPDKTRLTAHKDLLIRKSPYFKAALREDFAEGRKGVVSLPEVDPHVIPLFINWVYYNTVLLQDAYDRLPSDEIQARDFQDFPEILSSDEAQVQDIQALSIESRSNDGSQKEDFPQSYNHAEADMKTDILGKLYVFADGFQVAGLGEATMELLKAALTYHVTAIESRMLGTLGLHTRVISYLWENTRKEDPVHEVLRNYINGYVCAWSKISEQGEMPEGSSTDCLSEVPQDLLIQCLWRVSAYVGRDQFIEDDESVSLS